MSRPVSVGGAIDLQDFQYQYVVMSSCGTDKQRHPDIQFATARCQEGPKIILRVTCSACWQRRFRAVGVRPYCACGRSGESNQRH
ncbi:hypothetical protein KCP75_19550 [Salmonella enterica subsp. enterica]|nr:hypothetical protein KCP75_19550 [Salmonella enterica subsp. enterica]